MIDRQNIGKFWISTPISGLATTVADKLYLISLTTVMAPSVVRLTTVYNNALQTRVPVCSTPQNDPQVTER
jgi:hypothetical protein